MQTRLHKTPGVTVSPCDYILKEAVSICHPLSPVIKKHVLSGSSNRGQQSLKHQQGRPSASPYSCLPATGGSTKTSPNKHSWEILPTTLWKFKLLISRERKHMKASHNGFSTFVLSPLPAVIIQKPINDPPIYPPRTPSYADRVTLHNPAPDFLLRSSFSLHSLIIQYEK